MKMDMEFSQPPSKTRLMINAALKQTDPYALSVLQTTGLPSTCFTLSGQEVEADNVRRFNQVCGWPTDPEYGVHPCFMHVMAFPLHLKLMTQKAFPFKMLGLVHLHNEIQQFRVAELGQKVDIRCHISKLEKHEKGWLFTITTDVMCDQVTIWQSNSSNLYRCNHGQLPVNHCKPEKTQLISGEAQQWTFDTAVGRAYAKVSGDYNLIHLYPMTARLFGFKCHIAHGMYNKARCISAMYAELGEVFRVKTTFVKPLFLPADLRFLVSEAGLKHHFQLQSSNGEVLHLQGEAEPLSESV